MRLRKTKTEQLQYIAEKYRDAGREWPASTTMLARWAIENRMWEAQRGSAVKQCAKELAQALRDEYFTDPQGRRVRRMHALRDIREMPSGKEAQTMLWVDIFDAKEEQMQAAFQQRRMQVVGDCRQLKTDVDSYNDNNKHGVRIQMTFDFTADLMELEQPAEYVAHLTETAAP